MCSSDLAKVKSSVQHIEESPSNLIIIDSEYEGNNVKGIQIKIIQGKTDVFHTHTHIQYVLHIH